MGLVRRIQGSLECAAGVRGAVLGKEPGFVSEIRPAAAERSLPRACLGNLRVRERTYSTSYFVRPVHVPEYSGVPLMANPFGHDPGSSVKTAPRGHQCHQCHQGQEAPAVSGRRRSAEPLSWLAGCLVLVSVMESGISRKRVCACMKLSEILKRIFGPQPRSPWALWDDRPSTSCSVNLTSVRRQCR